MNLFGIARTHARIAGRQKALWIIGVPLAGFAGLLSFISPGGPDGGGAPHLAFTAQLIVIFTGVAYAAAFVDFFTTPARLGIHELEAAAPVRSIVLRVARVLGVFAVMVAPSALLLLIVGLVQTVDGHPLALLAAVAVTGTMVAPAALLAMAVSGLVGTILPGTFGRIVAVLIWSWMAVSTSLLPIPTLNGTILGVIGDTIGPGYFGAPAMYPPRGPLGLEPTPLTASVSLLWQLVLLVGLLAMGSWLAERARQR